MWKLFEPMSMAASTSGEAAAFSAVDAAVTWSESF
jgi:hypothetical protein